MQSVFTKRVVTGAQAAMQRQMVLNKFNMMNAMAFAPRISFSTDDKVQVQEEQEQKHDLESMNQRLGVDMTFSEQKHAYVLSFPWNYPEIIGNYEDLSRSTSVSGFWNRFANNSGAMVDFNNLFREFHQYCAIPDFVGMEKICEGRLAHAVNESIKRIQFHGLDIEMANLTVEQPSIQVIKVEIDHGLNLQRDANLPLSEYNVTESSIMGAPTRYYVKNNDNREIVDGLDEDNRPYNVSVTCLVESPMKLYVQNQNFSSVLFGSTDEEHVKNVVRFEANVQWSDLLRQLPVNNKPSMGWKITDFNNIMNENPHFDGQSNDAQTA